MRTLSRTTFVFQALLIIAILALAACAREAERAETPETTPDSDRIEQEARPQSEPTRFAPTGATESLAMDAAARRRELGDLQQPHP